MLQRLPSSQLLSAGKARRARYALRRPLRGALADLPVYAVGRDGRAEPLGSLALLRPQGSWLDLIGSPWPVPEDARDGWWPGLPYPLYDMRPQGYMGRQFARAEHRVLGVAPDPQAWSYDDIVHVLSQRGGDASGDLVLGDAAYAHWQASRLQRPEPLAPADTAAAYASLAEQAIAAGVPGSSAAGEFPKFTARRSLPGDLPSDTPHVLVKFSGADTSATVQRWADLLVCEHLALVHAASLPGVAVARSRVLQHAGRTFMEVERFDRHGEHGRSPLCSLETINAALLGVALSDWLVQAQRLVDAGWLAPEGLAQVAHLWWFGRLIANTDMHAGNLSFVPDAGRLTVAPAYDMLPMLYAPLAGGEVPQREFAPPLPLPAQRAVWLAACAAAQGFWAAAAQDGRISAAFRAVCQQNAARLAEVAAHA
jgi:hypothetical protein